MTGLDSNQVIYFNTTKLMSYVQSWASQVHTSQNHPPGGTYLGVAFCYDTGIKDFSHWELWDKSLTWTDRSSRYINALGLKGSKPRGLQQSLRQNLRKKPGVIDASLRSKCNLPAGVYLCGFASQFATQFGSIAKQKLNWFATLRIKNKQKHAIKKGLIHMNFAERDD